MAPEKPKNLEPWQQALKVERREGSRVPKGARKIKRPDGTYRWLPGTEHVQVWTPDGVKYLADYATILGLPWTVINTYSDYGRRVVAITPFHIKAFIERGFTPAYKPV